MTPLRNLMFVLVTLVGFWIIGILWIIVKLGDPSSVGYSHSTCLDCDAAL